MENIPENVISLAFMGIIVLCLAIGALLGLARGGRRSILRLVLVVLCGVGAIVLCDTGADMLLGFQMEGKSVHDLLAESFAEMQGIGKILIPLIKIMVKLVLFVLIFFVLKFISWLIVYPICKIFVRKGEKSHRLTGLLVGACQGVLVALFVVSPLSYLALSVGQLSNVDFASLSNMSGATAQVTEVEGFNANFYEGENGGGEGENGFDMKQFEKIFKILENYNKSAVGKVLGTTKGLADRVFSVKDENGETVSLQSSVGAVAAVAEIATNVLGITEEIKDLEESAAQLGDQASPQQYIDLLARTFEKIQDIKDKYGEKAFKVLQNVLDVALDLIPDEGDMPEGFKDSLKNIDLAVINFRTEANVVRSLGDYFINEKYKTDEDATVVLNSINQSKLFFVIIDIINQDSTIAPEFNISEEDKPEIRQAFDDSELTPEHKQALLKFMGLE